MSTASTPPRADSRADLLIALALLMVGAIARLLAMPASLWEYDDILFARALHKFDVTIHSPHPPGYPVFVMLGRLGYALLGDEHRAYAALSLVFGMSLGASLFYLCREIFGDSMVAAMAALIGSFVPNVWVHGSASRSDGPGLVLGTICLVLILRGVRSTSALVAAGALFGFSAGVRSTVVLAVGPAFAVVLISRLRNRQRRLVVAAIGAATIATLTWYVPLILYTGWDAYRVVVAEHLRFISSTDAIWAHTSAVELLRRFERFFIDIWGPPYIMAALYACSAGGLVLLTWQRRWRALGWLAVCFLPITAFSFAINAAMGAPLYALPYVPLFAGLAAFGLVTGPRVAGDAVGRPMLAVAGPALVGALAIAMITWTYPIVAMMRTEQSPSARAMQYLRAKLDPGRDLLYLERLFVPHAIFYLPDLRMRREIGPEGIAPDTNLIHPLYPRRVYSLTTEPVPGVGGQSFQWSSAVGAQRLRRMSVGRFFDIHVTGPFGDTYPVAYLSGWFPSERSGEQTWRWMAGRSTAALFNTAKRMVLRLHATIPDPATQAATVVLRLDGVELERLAPAGHTIDRTVMVSPGRGRLWSILSIESDRTFVPIHRQLNADDRELALMCQELTWSPAPDSTPNLTSANAFMGPGWYPLETNGQSVWRWTIEEEAVVYLPPAYGGARLEIRGHAAKGRDGNRPAVTVRIAGEVIDRIRPIGADAFLSGNYRVPASLATTGPLEFTLSADLVDVHGDSRRLGVAVTHLGWLPAEGR